MWTRKFLRGLGLSGKLGVWVHAPPENVWKKACSEINNSGAFLALHYMHNSIRSWSSISIDLVYKLVFVFLFSTVYLHMCLLTICIQGNVDAYPYWKLRGGANAPLCPPSQMQPCTQLRQGYSMYVLHVHITWSQCVLLCLPCSCTRLTFLPSEVVGKKFIMAFSAHTVHMQIIRL